ncbi:FlaA1/EpsC-like NDP-sugar epimerase [Roseivirga pacifica]|uniref:NDP-sugar epimerase, includes UDP-GlcNAc-inverting 4,6-dehydratase FlaA1 and capsular polysaccharide biosynthesis protein EpsC n=1 Tax=Roseivirga pacifica TaxID=1267423 RepID=A0A1I0QYR9_9BACT|nr:nucleoside-diphosphate sugar epimerase/dehydratase [Roseivirga pacifica]RKQ42320.1 FlaA1/EpsC-like NDP-sugar epimerase [Roseivirga pacifica]SEW33046.1 NDP-sugar epimerase, includes UDP-GlcNAc-inverting 4,6-dehydratase FlaA1 and capsular polysaccharide biosynthesis protein EpsC [Roseivirga pacifica]
MLNKFKTLNVLPRWIIVMIDLTIFSLSALVAYLLRLNFQVDQLYEFDFLRGITVYTVAGLMASLITRSFAGIIRYTGIQDTLRVLYANLTTLFIVFTINYLSENTFPYSIALIAFLVSLVISISYRLLVKELFAFYRTVPKAQKRVLIFGAGRSGMITKQLIDNDTKQNVKVVGFLEDNARKIGNVMAGVKIHSAVNDFEKLILKHSPSELIIATSNMTIERKNEVVDRCLEFGIKVSTVPSTDKWIGGEFDINQIQEVKIEDLLGRNTIQLKNKFIAQELNNKCVLITGAAGSIGSEIVRQVIGYNPAKVILLDQSETGLFEIENEIRAIKKLDDRLVSYVADVSNASRVRDCFATYKPNIVFHAAAYKHVPMMENNVAEAVNCNIIGTKNLADHSVEFEVDKFVMISTDKAVNPTSVMGATKRMAEVYVQSLNEFLREIDSGATKFITTRFGNVLGSNGSVIPIFKRQIQNGGPITVTHPDITRYFMTIPEACSLVLEAETMGKGGEIFVFDMGRSVKIVDLAKRMIQLSGLEEGRDIEIVFTGLRPGEKLYEELLDDAENNLATHHPKIMIAQTRRVEFSTIKSTTDSLLDILATRDLDQEHALVRTLKGILVEYKSKASKFETLD